MALLKIIMKRFIYIAMICCLVCIGLLCRSIKTNGYDLPFYSTQYELNDRPGYSNGFALVYDISSLSSNRDLFSLDLISYNSTVERFGFFINSISNNIVNIGIYNRSSSSAISSISLTKNSNLLYIQFLSDTSDESNYQASFYFNFISIYYNRLEQTDDIFYLDNNGYFLDTSFSNYFDSIYYNDIPGIINYSVYWQTSNSYLNGNGFAKGLVNLLRFNYRDDFTDNDFEEQLTYGFDDFKPFLPMSQVKEDYYKGDTAGYNRGYLVGDTSGYNRGYGEGYDDGVDYGEADGYDHGYDHGYDEGKLDGIDIGYERGYDDGELANNAVHPLWGMIRDIAVGIGDILAIKLGPGITIGTIVFVPLFFSALGLILWIWRRN